MEVPSMRSAPVLGLAPVVGQLQFPVDFGEQIREVDRGLADAK